MAHIQICMNCEEKCSEGNKFCRHCNTPEKRRDILQANNNIRHEAKLDPIFIKATTI